MVKHHFCCYCNCILSIEEYERHRIMCNRCYAEQIEHKVEMQVKRMETV